MEGCPHIAICDRNREGLVETEKYMKEVSTFVEILVYQVDMLEEEQVECMVQAAVNEWGRVDYAVNAAGKTFLFGRPVLPSKLSRTEKSECNQG